MKRVLIVLFFTALFFFYACTPTTISPQIHTAVAQTQTAGLWTPTYTPTINPDRTVLLNLLNDGYPRDPLEMALDIRYKFFDAWFPIHVDNVSRIFRIDVQCECVASPQCCTLQRMFVITMRALRHHAEVIIAQVPGNVIRVDVACSNGQTSLGVLSASWPEVKEYLRGNLEGHILGWHVTPNPSP